jgi:hypothetical protein
VDCALSRQPFFRIVTLPEIRGRVASRDGALAHGPWSGIAVDGSERPAVGRLPSISLSNANGSDGWIADIRTRYLRASWVIVTKRNCGTNILILQIAESARGPRDSVQRRLCFLRQLYRRDDAENGMNCFLIVNYLTLIHPIFQIMSSHVGSAPHREIGVGQSRSIPILATMRYIPSLGRR